MHIVILGIGGVMRDFARNAPEQVFARALLRRGHRVTAVSYHEQGVALRSARSETIDGVAVLRVAPRIWPGGELGRALDGLEKPDLLHIFHLRNVLVYNALRWAKRRGVPVVHSPIGPFHDAYLAEDREHPLTTPIHYERVAYTLRDTVRQLARDPRPRKQATNYLLHAPLRRVDRFIACSQHERDILVRMGVAPARCDVIPLWIEDAPAIAPDESILAKLSPPLVLFIGQLTPRKGYDLLVEAMPAVLARHPSATFVFVSHNPALQAQMEARAVALGVASRLAFVGRVSEAQKIALMRAAGCWAIPSRYEGFGLPLLEAMQAGVPLVAANIPVIDEIVTDNADGLLVQPENAEALAYGINALLGNPALRARLTGGGQLKLAEWYDEPTLIERVLASYHAATVLPAP